jgi:hypothetical protein
MNGIALPSVQSLLIEMRCNGCSISTGTAFVIDSKRGPLLITNWHNVSGRRPDTRAVLSPTGALPDEIAVAHNMKNSLGSWVVKRESLYANGKPRWIEHPIHAEEIDVVALPLVDLDDVHLYPHELETTHKIRVGPAEPVSVVGFPFGLQAGGSLAVWATGFVASEPDIDFKDLPLMLVDCRTRPGQSGSAVIAYRSGGAVAMEDGSTAILGGPAQRLLGCYSGRINSESDLGLVWKISALREIAAAV